MASQVGRDLIKLSKQTVFVVPVVISIMLVLVRSSSFGGCMVGCGAGAVAPDQATHISNSNSNNFRSCKYTIFAK